MKKKKVDYTSPDFWKTAPEGATHWEPNSRFARESFMKIENGSWKHYTDDSWYDSGHVVSERINLMVPRPAETSKWKGEGLPPVGTVCEFKMHPDFVWIEGKVIAHFHDGSNLAAAVLITDTTGSTSVDHGNEKDFRPLPSLMEKISAAVRETDLKEMYDIFSKGACGDSHSYSPRRGIEALYDAGYQKQQTLKD